MKTNFLVVLVAFGIISQAYTVEAADVFSFAGFTFNQLHSPDRAQLLGTNAVLGGATFSAGLPASPTSVINFPGSTGFNNALCLAPLTGLSTNSVRAVNLPLGNDGTATRHGIEVYWSNGRVMKNLTNTDFVIYESGSTSNGVEGVMARVHYDLNTWSDWYYFAPVGFQTTTNAEVLFSYGFDVSAMGVPADAPIDRLQLANLMQTDRISTTNVTGIGGGLFVGQGKVVFDGSSTNYPDAGLFALSRNFTTGTYDPDPLYVAALHEACELTTPTLTVVKTTNAVTLTWLAPSCYSLQSATNLFATNAWGIPAETVSLTNGQMLVNVALTNSHRFFRLVKP